MTTLTAQKCEACHSGAPRVSDDEMVELLKEVPGWMVKNNDDALFLEREFKFKDFKQAQIFANKVGDLAEEEFHHPSILLEWGKVTVCWWTHALSGLHRNDFICAAKTDRLFDN